MTLLENSFALYTSGKGKQEALKRRLHYLSLFNLQLLRKLGLLNESVGFFVSKLRNQCAI